MTSGKFIKLILFSLLVELLTLIPDQTWALGTPAGTIIRNFATATFNTADGISMPSTMSNEVTTIVIQVAAVDVSPERASNEVGPGSTVVFPVQVTNQGNGTDTFDLTKDGLPPDWPSILYEDLNRNSVLDPSEANSGNIVTQVTLAADSIAYLLIPVTAPITAQDGDSASVTLTATSRFDKTVKDSGTYTAHVATSVLSVLKFVTPINPKPLDVVTYTIQVENTGSRTAFNTVALDTIPANMSYVLESIRYGSSATVLYDNAQTVTDNNDSDRGDFGISGGNRVTVNVGDLAPGEVRLVFFRTRVNEGVRAGTVIDNKATGTFDYPDDFPQPPKDSPIVSVTVQFKADPRINISSAQGMGEPGDTLNYVVKIHNKANQQDVLNLTGQSSKDFSYRIFVDANRDSVPGNNGDFLITDTNADTKPDVGTMTQDDSLQLIVQVVITPGTPDSVIDVNTLTLVSATDPTVFATGTVTTRVKGPNIRPVKTVTPPGSQPAGKELVYRIVITNQGKGTARSVRFTDAIPAFTDYVVGSVTVDSLSRTDGNDADSVLVQNGVIQVDLGTLAPGASRRVGFRVKIKEGSEKLGFGAVVRNRGTVAYQDKSGSPFTRESNEVRTPVNPSIIKEVETEKDTLMAGDQLIYRIIIDNRGGNAVDIALRDTLDSILSIAGVNGNASVQVDGQIVLANWTPYDADRVDTIRVFTFVRNRIPMPSVARNQAFLTVSGIVMGSEIVETPLKSIGQTADGEIIQPDYLVPGEALLVTVRDRDLNTSPGLIEEVLVTVTNLRSGEKETILLRATGPDSDTFTALLPSRLDLTGVGPNNDGLMHVRPADQLQGLYHDERTQDGPPLDRTDVTVVLPTRITLDPNPRTIIGNGVDQSILTARVTDSLGRPLPDGTPVTFTTDKGKFPNGLQTIVIPVRGGNGEAEVVFTAPILDANAVANVFASFGGFDSDVVNLQVLPGAIGIRVFDQVRGVDITSLDDELIVELVVVGTTVTGQPFGPITISVDQNGLFSSDLIPPGQYTFVSRVIDINTGTTVLEGEPQNFIVNFDGSVTPPKNSIAGSIHPRGKSGGQQFAGLTVELLDENGNIVGTAITDALGRYEFQGLDPGLYTLRVKFPDGSFIDAPVDQRSRLVGQIVVNVEVLIDPFGQVFDAETLTTINGATVSIDRFDGQVLNIPPLSGTGAVPNVNNVNPYVTVVKGQFAFLFGGNQVGTFGNPTTYAMTVTPPVGSGYLNRRFLIEVQPSVSGPITSATPIRLTARSADGLELAFANSFSLTNDPVSIDNIAVIALNIPMFKNAPVLQLTKSTTVDSLGVNEPFEYMITVANIGNEVATGVTVADTLNPRIWRLIEAPGATLPAPNIAIWNIGDLQPGERDTMRIRLEVLPPQVNGIQVINTVKARMDRGLPLSAESGVFIKSTIRATNITLEPDPKTIVGNGTDFSFLTARVIDNEGNPLPDGTPVKFTTDKGTFENGLQEITMPITGGDGEAVAVFIAPVLTSNDTAKVQASFDNVASNTVNLEVLPGAIGVRVWDQVRNVWVVGGDSEYSIQVTLIGRSVTGEPIAYTVTLDKNGIFVVPDIPPGTYQLKAVVIETASGRVVSDGILQPIVVNFDGSTGQPKNAISGTVKGRTEKDGARYKGLTVELLDEFGSVIGTTIIDENGDYDFQGLEPGRYSVRFTLADGEKITIPVADRSRLSGTVVINVDVLIDPFGQTYDAVNRVLIPNMRVSLETLDGQVLPLPPLPGNGAYPNTGNINPFDTDNRGRFAFLFSASQVGTFGNPVTYLMKATPPDTSSYLPRRLRLTVQPANPGPISSDSPISVVVRSDDMLEIARVNSFTLTRDPQTADNIAVVAINIPMYKTAPFLGMTKTAEPDTLSPGQQTRFDIIVRNTGNEPAVGVTVVDTLKSAWRLISGSPGGQILPGNVVRWNIGDMAPGRVDTLWVQVELLPPQLSGSVITNTAYATTPRGFNVNASSSVVVDLAPTWEIYIRPLVNVVGPGDEIPWVVRFRNIGNEIAREFTLTDSVPDTHTPVWVINGQGDTTITVGGSRPLSSSNVFRPGGTINGQFITWPLPDFAPGQIDSAKFVTRTIDTLSPRTTIEDYAFIIGKDNRVWAASAAALTSREPKLKIVKETTRDTVSVGEEVEFLLVITNEERVPVLSGITLIDSLPASMQFVNARNKPVVSGNVLSWNIAPLQPGASDTTVLRVKIVSEDTFARNRAILRYYNEELTDDADIGIKPAPTLTLTKTVNAPLVEPGGEVEYTITMIALGDTISAVTVADTLPGQLAYVGGSSQPSAVYDTLKHILTWNFTSVLPGVQNTLTFRMTPQEGLSPGEHAVRNVAFASTPDSTYSSDPADVVISVPFFVLTKRTDQSVAETGDFVIYRLTFENLSASDNLTDVRIWDRLPHSFKYIEGTSRLDGQPIQPETVIGRDVIWRIPLLAARQLRELTYRTVVGSDALSGDGVNIANATATTPHGNTASAGPARATVRIRPDVFSQSQVVIGRAWVDENGNGLHDNGEPPVPGVAFLMEDGTRVVADQNGRFSIPEIRVGAHVLRLLEKNVPRYLEPVELGVRSAGDAWIRFVDVVPAGLTKANFPFRRLPEPPGSSLDKRVSVVQGPARYWIERLIRLEKRGPGTEEAYLDFDLLNDAMPERERLANLSTSTKKEAAGSTPKLSGESDLNATSDPAGATPKALDSRFRVVYRVYALGEHDRELVSVFQTAPTGYLWAPPHQQNTGAMMPGDSLVFHLAADILDLPILVQPRVDLENVPYMRPDSTVATRSYQLTLQSLGRAFADSTIRDVWFAEIDLPPPVKNTADSSTVTETPVMVYSGNRVQYTLDVFTGSGGQVVDRAPQGMTPVSVDSLGKVEGDSIRWSLPGIDPNTPYRLWTRMEASAESTVTVWNRAQLMEQDTESNQLVPGPVDSVDVTIKPRPQWRVTSHTMPETSYVQIENTTLENLGADSFVSGSAELVDVVQEQLFRVRNRLMQAPTQNLIISGHTDSNPINTRQYPNNFYLSMGRSNAVKQWLVRAGIDSTRIITRGYGPTRPVASNKTADGRRQNRRVELELVETVVDRIPYKLQLTRTTTVEYLSADPIDQAVVQDSLKGDITYLTDSATIQPLVSPGSLRWMLNHVKQGDVFTVTYTFEAMGVASGNVEFQIPTTVSYSLPDGQWITNPPVTGHRPVLIPLLDETVRDGAQGGSGE